MLNIAQMSNDFGVMLADIPQILALSDGTSVSGVVSIGPEADGLDISGVADQTKMTAFVKITDCAILPIQNDVIVFYGVNYRIQSVSKSDDGVTLMIVATGEFE